MDFRKIMIYFFILLNIIFIVKLNKEKLIKNMVCV